MREMCYNIRFGDDFRNTVFDREFIKEVIEKKANMIGKQSV